MANKILIKHSRNWGLDQKLVEDLAIGALENKKLDMIELSVIFVGRKKAKELNIKFRKMTYIPQVLGFPMTKEKDVDGWIRLGDIVICNEKLKYEAKFQKKSIKEILKSWLLHGVENLL